MNCVRDIPSVREEYTSLRKELDLLCRKISENGFEMDTPLEKIVENKQINATINKIREIKRGGQLFTNACLSTPEAKAQLKIVLRKLTRENNPYCTAKKGTLNEVFSDCFTAMNYLKLELGLISIEATSGKIEDAKSLSRKAINSIPAASSSDPIIFSSALTVAKADGVKLDESKIK